MQRIRRALVLVTVLVSGLIVTVATAPSVFAATITSPTGNPFVVPGNASGQPQPFTVNAGGFASGDQVFVEQCDGVPTTTAGWDPTTNCDLGSSPAPVTASAAGTVSFPTTDVNHRYSPFKGASPQELFNCLSPSDPSPNNGLPDFRNCKIRVSTNNSAGTSDQVFLNIQLPNAVAPPSKIDCGLSGSLGIKPTLSNVVPKKPKANKVKDTAALGTASGVACVNHRVAPGTTKFPISSGSVKLKGALPAGSNCSSLSTFPVGGMTVKIKWQGINPKNGKLSTAGKSLATVSSVTSSAPGTYKLVAPVIDGAFVGSQAQLTLRTDQSHATRLSACQSAGIASIGFTGVAGASIFAIV